MTTPSPEQRAGGGRRTRFADTPDRYGAVSRSFHWTMAYLLLWQCLMFVGWRILGEGFMRKAAALGPSHSTTGVLVLILILPRALWALLHRTRTVGGAPRVARLARAAYAMLYVLMFVIPAIALLRAYGSGKGLVLARLRMIPATGREIGALTAPADLLHGPLGWALAALLCGHIAMALSRTGRLRRMIGRPGDARRAENGSASGQ